MKRFSLVLITAVLMLSLVACSHNEPTNSENTDQVASEDHNMYMVDEETWNKYFYDRTKEKGLFKNCVVSFVVEGTDDYEGKYVKYYVEFSENLIHVKPSLLTGTEHDNIPYERYYSYENGNVWKYFYNLETGSWNKESFGTDMDHARWNAYEDLSIFDWLCKPFNSNNVQFDEKANMYVVQTPLAMSGNQDDLKEDSYWEDPNNLYMRECLIGFENHQLSKVHYETPENVPEQLFNCFPEFSGGISHMSSGLIETGKLIIDYYDFDKVSIMLPESIANCE